MSHEQPSTTLLTSLTKPRGVLLAVPVIAGAALLVGALAGGEPSVARDVSGQTITEGRVVAGHDGTAEQNSGGSAPQGLAGAVQAEGAAFLKNEAAIPERGVQVAASDQPKPSVSFSADQRDEIGKIVREYLLKNPNVLVEVSAELERQRKIEQEGNQAKVLLDEKKSIFRSPYDFVLGNPDGDITVVEYFDYNCGWCKRALDEVTKVVGTDKNVRVVMKEFPIFGEDSTFAAKAALASIKQNKYWDFHVALMKAKRVSADNTMDIAKSVGIDVVALKKEMEDPKYDRVIEENSRVAQALGMQGTPGFIVDTRVNFGYVPADGLRKLVADVRKEGCKVC